MLDPELYRCAEAEDDRRDQSAAPIFRLCGTLRRLEATGCHTRLPAGPTDTLGERVAEFFAASDSPERPLVGVLPFDPGDNDALYQPRQLCEGVPLRRVDDRPLSKQAGAAVAEPDAAVWADSVARCVARLAAEAGPRPALEKVVLARSLRVELAAKPDLRALIGRLQEDPNITAYAAPLPVAVGAPPATLVGATPELLVSRRGAGVLSNPLAGSLPRCADPEQDAAAARTLLSSGKDHDEHRYVVEAIRDGLAPLCEWLQVPEQPSLQATRSMWHLGTRIEGRLKEPWPSAATLAGLLHPTPAVCGTPRQAALSAIRALESVDRGFYAGAVGWVDAAGDGDWYVSIRCARVQEHTLRLFAGAGIVAGSQPHLEVAETGAKFRAMLDALGIDPGHDL